MTFLSHSLSAVATKHVALYSLSPDGDEGTRAAAVADVARVAEAYAVEIGKAGLVLEAVEEEAAMYSNLSKEYEEEGVKVEEEILKLRKELEKQKRIRREKEEYDALAGKINSELGEGTGELEAEIAAVNAEVDLVESRREAIAREVEKKERAFQLLLASVEDLRRMLEEEEEEEEEGGGGGEAGAGGRKEEGGEKGSRKRAKR